MTNLEAIRKHLNAGPDEHVVISFSNGPCPDDLNRWLESECEGSLLFVPFGVSLSKASSPAEHLRNAAQLCEYETN